VRLCALQIDIYHYQDTLCSFAGVNCKNGPIPVRHIPSLFVFCVVLGIGSRVASVLDSGAGGPRLKSQPRRCRVTVLGKLFTHIVPLFTKQRNW